MNTINAPMPVLWKIPLSVWGLFVLLGALLAFAFSDSLREMLRIWGSSEEYGYGYLIPVITAFLIWQRKDLLQRTPFTGSWIGFAIVLAGIGLFFLGTLATLHIIAQYAFVMVLAGAALALLGWPAFKYIAVPLLFLIFMIPLPGFLYNNLSSQLQLISSEIGVVLIRLFGISVHLQGNVIDLGSYNLQVVEACNGLRYLFPLASLSFIAAYFFKSAFWKRALIFLSSIPITVFMNSFRIGVIGILVEYWGTSMAEGFLHDFEGWAVFMVCLAILAGEMWVLSRIGSDLRPLRDVFALDFPNPTPRNVDTQPQRLPPSFIVAGIAILIAAIIPTLVPERQEIIPPRAEFANFPLRVGDWQGRVDALESIYLDALKLDDYLLAEYTQGPDERVGLYVAYYASQRAGQSAHSPRSCIPGDGWVIEDFSQRSLSGVNNGSAPLTVNRAVIKKGDMTQLVYYWFQQRGRNITNEYLVKWFLFWDSLTRQRSDGALIRMTTVVPAGVAVSTGDNLLTEFAADVVQPLDNYVPD